MWRKMLLLWMGVSLLTVSIGYAATREEEVAAKGGKKLSAQEIKDLLSKSIEYDYQSVVDIKLWGNVIAKPDGTFTVEWHYGGSQGDDDGKWWLEGDIACFQGKVVARGQKLCGYWYKISDTQYESIGANGQGGSKILIKR